MSTQEVVTYVSASSIWLPNADNVQAIRHAGNESVLPMNLRRATSTDAPTREQGLELDDMPLLKRPWVMDYVIITKKP